MKISKGNSIQIDSAINPTTFTYPVSSTATTTVFRGGTGGIAAADTVSLVVLVNYKTADGTTKTDGQIIKQKGSIQFNVQSASSGTVSLTRCTLVSTSTLAAKQMYIKVVDPMGNLFYASRLTNRYVYSGTKKYPYLLGTTTALNYADTTATTGVIVTNSAGGVSDDVYALVEAF